MVGYIFKRILWVIPSVFIIASMVFILSRHTDKDPVETLLELQGINSRSSLDYYQQYGQEYKKLEYDLPDYYISIQPNHFPKHLNRISNPNEKSRILNLAKQGYGYEAIKAFGNIIYTIQQDSNLNTYNILAMSPSDLMQSSLSNNLSASTKGQLESLISNRVILSVPEVKWHGINNQFHSWFTDFLKGNWGISFLDGSSVSDKITSALKWTISLMGMNFILMIFLGVPLVLWSIYKKGIIGNILEYGSLIFYIIPVFVLATLIQVFLTTPEYGMQIFPKFQDDYVSELSWWETIIKYFSKYLPALLCLLLTYLALFMRMLKSNIIREELAPYIDTAFSKGQGRWKVLTKHIFPNVLIPLITLLVGFIPGLIAGSLVVEVIFNIPGMGRLLMTSISLADWAVVYYIVIIIGITTILSYVLGDILTAWANPKISFTKSNDL
jgi:ABC-type dipeptide/oligopeptide/nickel transport system permease component